MNGIVIRKVSYNSWPIVCSLSLYDMLVQLAWSLAIKHSSVEDKSKVARG